MKKRLRKKLGIGEFRELYFDINCIVAEMPEESEAELFQMLLDLFQDYEMVCEGCLDAETRSLEMVVSTGFIDSDNETRYHAVKEKLEKVDALSDLVVSELY